MFIGNIEVKGLARLAPMAGISNAAYRTVARECGSALTTSEEIDATGLTRKNTKTRYDIAKYLPEEKPIALQILGANAETLVPGAQWLLISSSGNGAAAGTSAPKEPSSPVCERLTCIDLLQSATPEPRDL